MGKSKEIAELAGHFNVSSTEAVTAADLTVTGDLTVNGTNTTINSTTLTVDDKNIVVAQGSADAAAADGAGLTVDGASATLTYASTGDKFVFNKQVDSTVIRATSATDVSLSSTGHGFQVGADNTLNIAMDGNEIQARNGGGTSPLYLNAEGGQIYLGPVTGQTIIANDGNLTMYGTNTTSSTFDPILTLQRSPSDNSVSNWDYLGALYFNGKDSAGNNTNYGVLTGRIENQANGSETGRIEQYGLKDGTWGQQYVLSPYHFILSNGQQIQWKNWSSTYEMYLKPTDTITGERTIKLPDESGTVVLAETDTNFLSDVSITSGTDAKVTINDNIGEVGAGNIAFQASNSSGSALKPMGFRGEDIRFATGSTERMRIEDGGLTLYSNIGANSSTAFAIMDGRIGFDTDYSDSARGPNKILLQNDGNWISGLGISNNYLDIYSGGNIAFHRSTSPDAYTNNMTIQYDGKVGIGTTSPSVGLEVYGDSTGDEISIKYSGTAGGHNSKYLFKDFRGQTNAGIYNNLQDDGVGSAAAHMQFYTSHGGTLSSQMAISRHGHITTPNQPSCSITNMGFGSSATSWSSAGSGSVNGGLVGVAHHNNGNHYDTSTGYFTAPVAGYYLCNLNVYGKKDNNHGDNSGYWWGYFQKNGGQYTGNYIMEGYYNSGDYDQGASISAIIYLAANDTVRPYLGAYIHGVQVYGPTTGFSCHLLG